MIKDEVLTMTEGLSLSVSVKLEGWVGGFRYILGYYCFSYTFIPSRPN